MLLCLIDYRASCDQIKEGFKNDGVEALRQASKLRCWMFNSNEPFGKNFNRTLIYVKLSDGETFKLFVPTETISSAMANRTLTCDQAKICIWDNIRTTAAIPPTPTQSAPTASMSTELPTCRADRSCHEPVEEMKVKITYHFYDDDVSSLSHQDIAQWTWKTTKRYANDYCIQKRTIKMALPVEGNINELSRDLVSVQYEVMNVII